MEMEQIKTLTDEQIDEWPESKIRELFKNLQEIAVGAIKIINDATEVTEIKDKMIDMMAEQLAGCCILDYESSNNDVIILGSKEEALDYYYEQADIAIREKGEEND